MITETRPTPNHNQPSEPHVLVLGGTGKTGSRLAMRLQQRGVATRIASRSGSPWFDWNDQNTWPETLLGVTAVYISYSPDLAILGAKETIQDFVAMAVDRGIRRLVLLSGRGEREAQYCERIVRNSETDWTVIRAAWFNQNFSEGEFLGMIKEGLITLLGVRYATCPLRLRNLPAASVNPALRKTWPGY